MENKGNVGVCEMEAKAFDLFNEITEDGTDLKEALMKRMVLNCLPSISRQHLHQAFEKLPYEDFMDCAKTEEVMCPANRNKIVLM
ncbi:Uncharacterized protein FKW44_005999 [Caligus rogercresseyi]|uniref:Uncharacterized protein n=1 Tax=Caligus rogercresseyi TaxID=217165 RepID=A0A7T8QSI0_CALRO|nr:Uncharacterized protein FKW44_005999 [Caligus rogercresseyi]